MIHRLSPQEPFGPALVCVLRLYAGRAKIVRLSALDYHRMGHPDELAVPGLEPVVVEVSPRLKPGIVQVIAAPAGGGCDMNAAKLARYLKYLRDFQ